MISRNNVEAFLLAGGASRRMGSPKAGLIVGGEPIASRVARTIAPHVCRMTVVTDRPDEVVFLDIPTIADIHKGIGPLGGLHAALKTSRSSSIFLAAIDLPFVSEHLVLELLRRHGPAPTTVPHTDDGLHPLCAVFDRSVLSDVERHIQEKRLSIRDLVEEVGMEIVDLAHCQPPIESYTLVNINSPTDLSEARARCSR